jgi:exodeoxyribonuclease III
MRIATWNINGLKARLELLKLWLQERQPDVVGLQELKTPTSEFPHEVFKALGYHALVHGQKSWNGVAILSREPAELLQVGLPGEEELGARLITARVGGLEFTTVYCPNGKTLEHEDYGRKLKWFESLRTHWLQQGRSAHAVLCGDFNIVPEPKDSWQGNKADGEIFHTEAERSRYQALVDTGLVDLFRHHSPDESAFSWWDYRGGAFHRRQGLRIDLILGTPSVVSISESAGIDREYRKKQGELTASDHAPVIAELK